MEDRFGRRIESCELLVNQATLEKASDRSLLRPNGKSLVWAVNSRSEAPVHQGLTSAKVIERLGFRFPSSKGLYGGGMVPAFGLRRRTVTRRSGPSGAALTG